MPVIVVPSNVVRLLSSRTPADVAERREAFLDALSSFVSENIRAFWCFEPETPEPIYPYGHRTVTTQDGCRRMFPKGTEE